MAKPAPNVETNVADSEWETVVEPYADSWDFQKNPELIGTYLGSKVVQFTQVNKETGELETRESNVYEIQTKDGDKFSVWGSYNIDAAFLPGSETELPVGSMVRILHEGKAPLDGGRSVNKFTVQVRRT